MGERLAEEVIFYILYMSHQWDFSVCTSRPVPMLNSSLSKIGYDIYLVVEKIMNFSCTCIKYKMCNVGQITC